MFTYFAPEMATLLALVVPIFGFLGIMIFAYNPNIRETVTLLTGVVTLYFVLTVFHAVAGGARPEFSVAEIMPGLSIAFRVEPLGALFGLIASGLWIVNSVYSIGYMRGTNETKQTRFYMSFALAIMAAIGVAFASNLLTLFIFYEILTISTFPLVTHKQNEAARKGGTIYLGILMGTSIGLLLPAIIWTYFLTGTTEFSLGGILATHVDDASIVVSVLLGLYAFGIGKAALMPVHPWLPNAMVAPTPVSAFLHAVAVVKAGVFSLLKVVIYIFGLDFLSASGAAEPFMWLAAFSILAASAIAMTQDNLKARLAYSTISQLGYVTLGAMLATSLGAMGGGVQIAMHALGKMTLFMCAGAIYVKTHKTLISEMNGLGRKMPITFGAFFIGALSIIGLPPLGGAWPKLLLMMGSYEAGHIALLFVLALSSVLNVIYLLSIPLRAFYFDENGVDGVGDGPQGAVQWGRLEEAPILCIVPPVLTAIGCLLMFFMINQLTGFLSPIMGGS